MPKKADTDENSIYIYLMYHFHRADEMRLIVKPFLQDLERGVFATRAPCRPNAIGLSVVALDRVEGNVLYLDDVDDETARRPGTVMSSRRARLIMRPPD